MELPIQDCHLRYSRCRIVLTSKRPKLYSKNCSAIFRSLILLQRNYFWEIVKKMEPLTRQIKRMKVRMAAFISVIQITCSLLCCVCDDAIWFQTNTVKKKSSRAAKHSCNAQRWNLFQTTQNDKFGALEENNTMGLGRWPLLCLERMQFKNRYIIFNTQF